MLATTISTCETRFHIMLQLLLQIQPQLPIRSPQQIHARWCVLGNCKHAGAAQGQASNSAPATGPTTDLATHPSTDHATDPTQRIRGESCQPYFISPNPNSWGIVMRMTEVDTLDSTTTTTQGCHGHGSMMDTNVTSSIAGR